MSCDKSKCSTCSKGCSDSFKDFRVKDHGYSTFAKFVQSIPGLEVCAGKGSSRIVKVRAD